MLLILLTRLLLAGEPALPETLVAEIREELPFPDRALGYTAEDLAPYRFPCRLPAFDGWVIEWRHPGQKGLGLDGG